MCCGVAGIALLLTLAEQKLFGRAWLEPLVMAILAGAALRTVWTPPPIARPGITFGAKTLLEVAVVLLGGTVSGAAIMAMGPAFLCGIALVVALAIAASIWIGRMLGLSPRLAILVACGNSICGNSAIAAVAPVIRANGEDVAKSIAFTAVLGVAVVVGLPLVAIALKLDAIQSGALAGLTVYAVPQVLAASAPFGATAIQVGTLVKLVRVLMLGPVCLALSLLRANGEAQTLDRHSRPRLAQLVPWFIVAFLALLGLRSAGVVPSWLGDVCGRLATAFTVVAMAGLGLGVDLRSVARAGAKVTLTVILSLLALGTLSLLVIHLVSL